MVSDNEDQEPHELGSSIRLVELQSVDIHKVCIIGDSQTGKTSIVVRFTENRFPERAATVGCDCAYKSFVYQNSAFKFIIWDVAGGQNFRTLVPNYFRGADVFIVVYDCTNKESFNNVEEWNTLIRRYDRGHDEHRIVILCGNKIDKRERDEEAVRREDGEALAQRLNMMFQETSALTDEGVTDLFYKACEKLMTISPPNQDQRYSFTVESPTVNLRNQEPENGRGCC